MNCNIIRGLFTSYFQYNHCITLVYLIELKKNPKGAFYCMEIEKLKKTWSTVFRMEFHPHRTPHRHRDHCYPRRDVASRLEQCKE